MSKKLTQDQSIGAVTSLRICYKPSSGSKIIDLVGRKSTKELSPGESCLLFMKLHVPRIRSSRSVHVEDMDQESLFEELQSIVGTLEQDVLHVETRYKHSLLPGSNTLTCRVACNIRRPKTDSRWSICSAEDDQRVGSNVHERLAKYIISHCPPEQALDLIRHHLGPAASAKSPINTLCHALKDELQAQKSGSSDKTADKPSILISDTSLEGEGSITSPTPSGHYDTAPCSPSTESAATAPTSIRSQTSLLSATPARVPARKSSAPAGSSTISSRPLTSAVVASKPITALPSTHSQPKPSSPPPLEGPPSPEDNARALWKHIRQSSLSALQLVAESAPEALEQLERGDESLRALRRQALANKRSVGAETLRAWRWEGRGNGEGRGVGAPWM